MLVARDEGIDTALVFGLMIIVVWLPDDESERALRLLDEAIAVKYPDRRTLGAVLGGTDESLDRQPSEVTGAWCCS